jgi:hypothetical protein
VEIEGLAGDHSDPTLFSVCTLAVELVEVSGVTIVRRDQQVATCFQIQKSLTIKLFGELRLHFPVGIL